MALGYLAIATLIALYALGGKLFPWLDIRGLIDLNHADRFSRLRAPLDYWNALALVCVMAVPVAVRAGADLGSSARLRLAAHARRWCRCSPRSLSPTRAGACCAWWWRSALVIGIGPERLRLAATAGRGPRRRAPAVLLVFFSDDLTTDGLRVSDRVDDGLLFLAAGVIGLAIAFVLARRLIAAGERVGSAPAGTRRREAGGAGRRQSWSRWSRSPPWRCPTAAWAARSRTPPTTFTETKFDRQNDPARVLRTNSGNRWVWWEEAMGGFSDRPLIGHGAGSFPLTHLVYRDNLLQVEQPTACRSSSSSETGLVGALLALGALALLAAAAVRVTRARGRARARLRDRPARGAAGGRSCTCGSTGTGRSRASCCPRSIFLGVLAATPPSQGNAARPPRRGGGAPRRARRRWRGCRVRGRGAGGAAGAVARRSPTTRSTRPRAAQPDDLREGAEKAARAKRLNPFAVAPAFAQASILERGNRPADALGVLLEAVDRQPANPAVWSRLSRFQILRGRRRRRAAVIRRSSCCSTPAATSTRFRRSSRSTTRPAPPAPPARRCR